MTKHSARTTIKHTQTGQQARKGIIAMTTRDMMQENGGFLDWCGCFYSENDNAYLIDEPGSVSIYKPDTDEWITGKDVDLEQFARAAVKDYDSFSGWSDLALIVNNLPRKDCRNCPCFGYCEAMDAEIDS